MLNDTLASPFVSAPIAGARHENPDMDMIVDLFISEEAEICILHDKPFSRALSWLEYDPATSMVDFVMEDGDIRNFGVPVDPALRKYFHNAHVATIVHWDRKTRISKGGFDLPLIVHAAA